MPSPTLDLALTFGARAMHLLIVTPIYPPTTGGAATYYGLLTNGLLASGNVTEITIVTERVPGCPTYELKNDGRLRIIRWFPHRAGRHLGRVALYWRYGIQNLQYFFLPNLIRRLEPDVMLVHSSVHIHLNTLRSIIPYFCKRFPVVADVRDHQLPTSRLDQLEPYSALIACSRNVIAHVSQAPELAEKVIHIPVIQEFISRNRPNALQTLTKYGLHQKGYLIYSGLIKQGKGIGLLLDVFAEIQRRGIGFELVLAGFSKDTELLNRARSMRGVHVVGAVPREQLLDLMSAALMSINLSPSEGMPRTSLEAVALGIPVLLPPGIPEFDEFCRTAVVGSDDPSKIADQIQSLLSASHSNHRYPITMHEVDAVVPQYIDLFRAQFKKLNSLEG